MILCQIQGLGIHNNLLDVYSTPWLIKIDVEAT